MRRSFPLLLVCLLAGRALASGEPGASYSSKYYRLTLSAGVRKIPAGGAGSFFEREERAYLWRLSKALPALTRTVDQSRAALHVVPWNPEARWLRGVVIGDKDEDADLEAVKAWKAAPAPGTSRPHLRVQAEATLPGTNQRLTLWLTVNAPVTRAALNALAKSLAAKIPPNEGRAGDDEVPGFARLAPVTTKAPGLTVQVRPEHGAVESKFREAMEQQHGAFAQQVLETVRREVGDTVEAGGTPFHAHFGSAPREVTLEAQLPRALTDEEERALRRRISDALWP